MDQDVHVEGKSVPDFKSDSESSSGSKESSGQTQRGFRAAMDEIEITSGSKEQSNAANNNQHNCKEPSRNMWFSCYFVDALNSCPEIIVKI
uniref:Uncharacterized protein n=1 Tax=Aegilops tauschii subsp. strangulata TaxID=200361 RepID=A0A453KP30_AEGTS